MKIHFRMLLLAAVAGLAPVRGAEEPKAEPAITVASYYFGNYHPGDARNTKTKGAAWSEWELVKAAKPRFPGHQQPHVPLWGYGDESDPAVMAQKIDAAADHGINAFIFDWYYYNDGPFLERPIDNGFLKAPNNHRLKFAFMWANHDWQEIHPYRRGTRRQLLYPGAVTPENFEKICDLLIRNYFQHPSYWKIDGKPYFSFYDLTKLLENFGSVPATRAALDKFRDKAKAAGLPGLHLNAVVWGRPNLPSEKTPADAKQLVRDLGFDSVTSYVWIHHAALPQQVTDYNRVRDSYFNYWDGARTMYGVPYFPNVTMGWDPSPRADQRDAFGNFGYPFTNTIGNNTPENFRAALLETKKRLLAQPSGPRVLNINCWNEWTEGSYLEPDTVNGLKYLEAVRDVFGAPPASSSLVTLDGTAAQGNPVVAADGFIHRVEKPVLHLMRTAAAAPKGTILLFPGGGYHILAIGHEGIGTAEFLNQQGFDVAVLEYTIASGPATRDRALNDALTGWRLIRGRAQALGLHGNRFGVMGYSAGGHLAARLTATLPAAEQPDDVILIYPAYLHEPAAGTHLPAVRPPPAPPGRLFALIAANDRAEWVASCRDYAGVWKETGGAVQLELLKDGGHGFGMRPKLPGDAKRWPELLADFLRTPPAVKPGK